jgi:hypothetical protein
MAIKTYWWMLGVLCFIAFFAVIQRFHLGIFQSSAMLSLCSCTTISLYLLAALSNCAMQIPTNHALKSKAQSLDYRNGRADGHARHDR